MECTQVLLSESFDVKNSVTEKIPVATLLIDDEYHTIYNTENVIGREKSCDIVISNSAISSRHAVIEAEDSEAHLIYDVGSTNKTKLGKMVLKPHVRYHINDGDCVTFGNVSAQYNISRKYLSTPVKGDAALNSCSIPETPERLISTLELDACDNTKQKGESSSVLELSDTDLFDEKEGDSNVYPKEIPSSRPNTNRDIYELDTLSFDENVDNHVKKTGYIADLNKLNVIPAKNNVEVEDFDTDPQELVNDEENMPEAHPMYDKDKGKNNFAWEDFPEIASPVGLDSSNADNIDCPKFKVSSSFLDITNDDLKSDQHNPKNIGGVILSDLCKPAGVDSDRQDISSTSNVNDFKVINVSEKGFCSKKTSIDDKAPHTSGLEDGQYSDNDIPMSQNIDMFEESSEKTMIGSPEQCDVYEMLTQVSVENKDINNINNSIYDIQTQVVTADDDAEFKVDNVNESGFIMPSNSKLSTLEPATQPSEINETDERNDNSHLKPKVVDETDNNCSFSESVYEAETQTFLQNDSGSADQNQLNEKTASLPIEKLNKNGKNCNLLTSTFAASSQPVPEILDSLPKKMDLNGTVASAVVEVATQQCSQGSLEIIDSLPAEISNKKENFSITITEELPIDSSKESHCSEMISVVNDAKIKDSNSSSSMLVTETQPKPYSPHKPQLLLEDNTSVKDLTMCDWYDIATQPCRPTSENVGAEQEVQKNELTNNDELFHTEAERNSSFSSSIYEIATQPCPKVSEKNAAINEAILNTEFITISNENYKNSSFSTSLCEIATQPCSKDIPPEKIEFLEETALISKLSKMNDESNTNNIFSDSICEIATQPCPKDISPEKSEYINETDSNSKLTRMNEESNPNNIFSNSMCEIATQPCPKDITPEKIEYLEETASISKSSKMNDESNPNNIFSDSMCEIATQPCPKDISPEKIDISDSICEIATQPCPKDISPEKSEYINETDSNSKLTRMNEESNPNNIFSNSMCEIATQPCPKDITPEKIEYLEETASISKSSKMNDESNPNNIFSDSMCEIATQPCPKDISPEKIDISDSICEIATQPCPKDISPEKSEYINENDSNSKLTRMNEESNPKNIFSDSMCEIATQPCPNDISPEKIKYLEETASISKSSKMNDESNPNNIFSDSMCEIATQPCPNDISPEKIDISDSICEIATQPCPKDIFPEKNGCVNETILNLELTTINDENNRNNIVSNTICEIATQPCPKNITLGPVPGQIDSNLGKNENLSLIPKVSEMNYKVEGTGAKADVEIEKAENIQITHNPNGFSLTATLPNTLSDSFFEAATQPYKNDQGADRTYPDPLTSICNDLSDDKIGEISDELMCGNISTKLEESNKNFYHNKSRKECNEFQKNSESSDHNIYEALADRAPFSSQKKILLNNINSENPPEKMSTQDLQRILESDDLTQKNIEFKKNNETSISTDNILNSDKNAAPDDANENSLKSEIKKSCIDPSVADSHAVVNKVVYLDSDSSQELNIRSNKKRCNIFPPDSLTFTNKFFENDDSSQELNIRSNKKRSSVFPSDSQSFTYKFLDNDDSSQELNIRSNKKRCNVFPPDSQTFSNKFLDNEDSSQELNIKSNKKRYNVFPSDSQDFNYKNLESVSNKSKEESVRTQETKSAFDGATSCDFLNKINDIQKQNNVDSISKIVSNTSIETGDQLDIKKETMVLNNELYRTTNDQDKDLKEKLSERISASGKRNSKENKNKSPTERERELNYISRGNITLHSPEVLSELEEQFRLTKVAMSPTQLSVVSDIEDEIQSSQEVTELDMHGIRRSIRNRKNTLAIKSSKNNKSPISHEMVEPAALTLNENFLKENESKRKETKACSDISKSEKSFKKFKKVSPIKNNSPINEEIVKVATNEAYVDIASNHSDNSQNSEELGRGKRKRTRPSYEGFIIEEEKKRTSRKKLFSNSDDSENMNNATANIKESNNVVDESVKIHDNDAPSNSIKQTVSVVLHDVKKASTDVIEPKAEKNTMSKKKPSKKSETSHVPVDKLTKLPNSSINNESKQNETISKDKSCSFSFSEKLDELFNIWGPADRVKLSPRTAKKSYKLLAGGKNESASPTTNSNKSHTVNILDKEPKPSSSRSNKNNLKNNEKKSESFPVVATNVVTTNRKRNLSQKNEVAELPDVSKQNKKRRKTNSETSETSQPDTNDSEIRKSSRITRKKTIDIPVPDLKPETNPGEINKNSNNMSKRGSNQSTESIENSTTNNNKNVKGSLRNSSNISMKPPSISTVIVNVKNKNSKTKGRKNPIHIQENSSTEQLEENYCFSQEYSFHENKIEKGKKKSSDDCSNLPLKIRRSGRKKNEKTAEKNIENVMFTGFADKKAKSLVNVLGGHIVESPFTCTVLVTDKIRRTTKFLSALSRGLPIVSPQWLIDSNENGRFLDASDFLLSDNEAERKFSFNLKKSIEKAQNGKVLDGWAIFVTPSVKPSPEEMKSIIECSGGRFLSKELTRWPANSLIVSCDEDRAMWPKFSKKGKTPIIVDNEAILLGVLRQELDLESHKLL